jgi:hypothetical protein
MTTTFFTSSQDQSSQIWFGGDGDGIYVSPGVSLTDEDTSGYPAFGATSGNVTAQIFGSIAAVDVALGFGGNGAQAGPGTATIQIGSAGSVTSTNSAAIDILSGYFSEAESIANAGLIDGAGDGIVSQVKGTITNNGAIYAGVIGVHSTDSVFGDIVQLNTTARFPAVKSAYPTPAATSPRSTTAAPSTAGRGSTRSIRTPPPPKRSPITRPGH